MVQLFSLTFIILESNMHPIGINKYFAWKENALPDSYKFPKDFPKNIHDVTEE